eukprot:6181178-Pleurochrysis_carterae.AAC.3
MIAGKLGRRHASRLVKLFARWQWSSRGNVHGRAVEADPVQSVAVGRQRVRRLHVHPVCASQQRVRGQAHARKPCGDRVCSNLSSFFLVWRGRRKAGSNLRPPRDLTPLIIAIQANVPSSINTSFDSRLSL